MKCTALVVGLVLALASANAFADDAKKDVIRACKGDIKKFCANVQPGNERIKQCLKGHAAELSARCKQEILFAAADKK
jgi:hypothetical protein